MHQAPVCNEHQQWTWYNVMVCMIHNKKNGDVVSLPKSGYQFASTYNICVRTCCTTEIVLNSWCVSSEQLASVRWIFLLQNHDWLLSLQCFACALSWTQLHKRRNQFSPQKYSWLCGSGIFGYWPFYFCTRVILHAIAQAAKQCQPQDFNWLSFDCMKNIKIKKLVV